jgi:hypothetical protein
MVVVEGIIGKRHGWGGVCVGGLVHIVWVIKSATKNNGNKINVGLKWPLMDKIRSNNQPTVSGSNRLDVGDKARWSGSLLGYTVPLFGASNRVTQKQ